MSKIFAALCLVGLSNCHWSQEQNHLYGVETSSEIKSAIKDKL